MAGAYFSGACQKIAVWGKNFPRQFNYLLTMSADSSPAKSSAATDEDPVDSIRRNLAHTFLTNSEKATDPVERILDEVNLNGIVKWIKSDKCKKIITLAGAGISTSAGIPDFRSPGTGLYDNLQKYDIPKPEAIFEINYFKSNPKPFFTLAKELYPGNFKPTISHYFIKLLHEKGLLLRHYTQNIDALERGAGIPEEKLVEAHGTFLTAHCTMCRESYSHDFVKEKVFADEVPMCTRCPGIVKPDIVFFGESLPDKFAKCIGEEDDFSQCDLLIIMGSSLEVQPFASLIEMVPETCPRLLINREKAGVTSAIYALLGMAPRGLQLDPDKATRDVALLGDCDDGCKKLAEQLGWGDELAALVAREHARLNQIGKVNTQGDLTSPHASPQTCASPASPLSPSSPPDSQL